MTNILYHEIAPPSSLDSYVKSFWHFENNSKTTHDYSILPDGCFDFLVYNNGKTQLTGLWSQRIDISLPSKTKIFAIRFKPLAAEYLLENSIKDLLNSSIQHPKNNVIESLEIKMTTFHAFAKTNSSILAKILKSKKEIDPRKEKVFELLSKTNGAITISEISKQSAWSSRQINRYFTSYFGLPTKQYANILKVFSTYKDLANGELFPKAEYFDQSHFIKEVKKYTGAKPKELSQNKNDRFLQLSTKKIE